MIFTKENFPDINSIRNALEHPGQGRELVMLFAVILEALFNGEPSAQYLVEDLTAEEVQNVINTLDYQGYSFDYAAGDDFITIRLGLGGI